ncbi:MAG TPA: PilZ domain-containing protein [Desulfobacteraceae bacterium]|nr:PilZ domain-containing protein [Desulfobacteraceae bacterium]
MTTEHRRFSRIPFKAKAELLLPDASYPVEEISNLSVGGCLLPLFLEIEPGSPCGIRIMLEGTAEGMSIRAEGKVIRATEDGVALQFTRIDPDSLFHLQNIIRYNAADADRIELELSQHPGLK